MSVGGAYWLMVLDTFPVRDTDIALAPGGMREERCGDICLLGVLLTTPNRGISGGLSRGEFDSFLKYLSIACLENCVDGCEKVCKKV
jgi:hypothetical protein